MSPEHPETMRVVGLVIDVLEDLGIRYHVGGSFASSVHGIPRQTQDVDLVVELETGHVDPLVSQLEGEFHVDGESARAAIGEGDCFNLIHLQSGIKVDLFSRGDSPFDREEFSRGRSEIIATEPERRAFVKSPEDTILRKLLWYRDGGEVSDRQWVDVLGVVRTQGSRLDRPYLRRWAEQLEIGDLLERALSEA